jgi:3-oxoacyl-[acyl-carrier-protein] synthase II
LFGQGGSAVLILESLEHAKKRGANIIAEIIGYGETCDAHNIMMMEQSGIEIKKAVKYCLRDAKIRSNDIDYINAHGTGTLLNDEIESMLIKELFKNKPLVNSTKSLIGHTLGASGAIEAVVTALSIKNKTTHVSKNIIEPVSDLNFVKKRETYKIRTALSQSFGFGGHNSVIAFKEMI